MLHNEHMKSVNSKSKILYDGNCYVCDFEVSHYKKIAPEIFEIVDISDERFRASEYNLTFEEVNKKMHVLTPDQQIKSGVQAFIHIWSRLPNYIWLSKLVSLPVIYQLACLGYFLFANIRHYLPKKKR